MLIKKRELTEEEKRFQTALRMGGITAEDRALVQALRVFKAVTEKGGDFTLRDSVAIEAEVNALYEFPAINKKEEEETKNEEPAKASL